MAPHPRHPQRNNHAWRAGFPVAFDERGFRVPISATQSKNDRPLVLALGCSFTFGDACAAEDAFPHRVAVALGGKDLNAGVCSYGLAQMVLLAERLVPQYRPDYVLVQYAAWLPSRSMSWFAPSYFSYSPTPYFSDEPDGEMTIQPPVFKQRVVNLEAWKTSSRSLVDFSSFFFRCALPLQFHDDLSLMGNRGRRLMGLVPRPTKNRSEAIRSGYARIRAVCEANNAVPLVVALDCAFTGDPLPSALLESGLPVVDAHSAMRDALSECSDTAFREEYQHFAGNPRVLIDTHPNPRAHAIIAEAVVKRLRGLNPALEPPSALLTPRSQQ